MTYREAEIIMADNIDMLRTKKFFRINGMNCQFSSLLAMPEDSTIEFKQLMYDECIKRGVSDLFFLRERDLLSKEMKVFMVYLQGGREIIIPFDDHMIALTRAT